MFSFVSHAAGVKLLYSNHINNIYYPLKKLHLSSPSQSLNSFYNIIEGSILNACNKALSDVAEYLMSLGQYSIALMRAKDDKIIDTIKPFLKTIIQENTRELIFQANNKKISADVEEILPSIKKKLLTLFLENYPESKADELKAAETDAIKNIKEILDTYEINLDFDKHANTDGLNHIILQLKKRNYGYPEIANSVAEKLRESPAKGKVSTVFGKFRDEDDFIEELLHSYLVDLTDLNDDEEANDEDKENFSKVKPLIKNPNRILMKILTSNIDEYLSQSLEKAIIDRKVLEANYTFLSHNAYSFIANIRLSNRSQKRFIKNKTHMIFKEESALKTWQFIRSGYAIEQQDVTSFPGRNEEVLNAGNYDAIYEKIRTIKENLNIDDVKLATIIRSIIAGDESNLPYNLTQELMKTLCTITYLIFGCEATRNPAMFVSNQMLLDLIIQEKTSWENALKIMPMAPKGATPTARELNESYKINMPYPYVYPGTTTTPFHTSEKLSKAEANIFKHWLKLKKLHKQFEHLEFYNIQIPRQRIAEWLLRVIEESHASWFEPPKPKEDDFNIFDSLFDSSTDSDSELADVTKKLSLNQNTLEEKKNDTVIIPNATTPIRTNPYQLNFLNQADSTINNETTASKSLTFRRHSLP